MAKKLHVSVSSFDLSLDKILLLELAGGGLAAEQQAGRLAPELAGHQAHGGHLPAEHLTGGGLAVVSVPLQSMGQKWHHWHTHQCLSVKNSTW